MKPNQIRVSLRLIIKIVITFSACLLCEIFVFNFRYFLPKLSKAPQASFFAGSFSNLEDCKLDSSGNLALEDGSSFEISSIGLPLYSIKLNLAGKSQPFNLSVYYEDDNFSQEYQDGGKWSIDETVDSSVYLHVITSGNCKKLRFKVSGQGSSSVKASLRSAEINAERFHFSGLRFFLLLSVCLGFFLLNQFGGWQKRFSDQVLWQKYAFLFVLAVSLVIAASIFLFCNPGGTFNREIETGETDSYQLLTQAFYHRRFSFLVEPSSSLASLSNPYDLSQRESAGMLRNVDYLWDSIYYKGHYYSYFGIAPVITLLLPFKLITGFYMPTSIACFLFTAVALTAALTVFYSIVRTWYPNTGFSLFFFGAFTVGVSNLLWTEARPLFYELAEISAIAFLMLALAALFSALRRPDRPGFRLFLGGLFFGLSVASRPTFIFYLLLGLPLLFRPLVLKNHGAARRLRLSAAFGAPLCVLGALVGTYNALRFGSPLDFGIKYQLSVSDIRFNRATNFPQLIEGIYHYYLQPLRFDLNFPFFHTQETKPSGMALFSFNYPTAGIFNYPVMIALLAAIPVMKKMRGNRPGKKGFLLALLLSAAVVSYLDITLAGALMRYTLDIYPVLLLASLMIWMEAYDYFASKGAGVPVAKIFAAVAFVSCMISFFICLTGEDSYFSQLHPGLYLKFSKLFEFWM